ncbi:Ataxin-3, partial [Fragariocoptes setiger]
MSIIFHEKQDGSLCAVHALNALLQGEYFTAVDLASLANQVDDQERRAMAEAGPNNESYLEFLSGPSQNMDDSGFFSVQVLEKALAVWNLELINYESSHEVARSLRNNPSSATAYIANQHEHWLTIRRFGPYWFNLNSLLPGPERISDTFLSLYLAQLLNERYSIFIVHGTLPTSAGDRVLVDIPQSDIDSFLKLIDGSHQ